MFKRSFKLAGVALVAASLAFTGCGSRTQATTGGNAGAAKVAKIGFIAPLSGDLSALGLGIRNSVDLAIRQANESNAIPGCRTGFTAIDSSSPMSASLPPPRWLPTLKSSVWSVPSTPVLRSA